MGIRSERYPAWPAHSAELRALLGLPKKLGPDAAGPFLLQGYRVRVLSAEEARQHAGHGNKPHRIFAQCPTCGREIPAGRLQQHENACR